MNNNRLKFRAWDSTNKRMFYSAHDYLAVPCMAGKEFSPFVRNTDNTNLELMQWTGLCDVDGGMIWEGDVFYDEYGNSVLVFWNDDLARFECRGINDMDYIDSLQKTDCEKWHRIGNKFEHPQLIEKL